MENPVISEDSELGEDTAEDISDVAVNLIYLDDDEIPELVIANGDRPENPVHLLSYDPDLKEIVLIDGFSMYGKMYYEPKTGNFIPNYYMPLGDGIVYRYEDGEYEEIASWLADFSGEQEQYFVSGKKAFKADVEQTYDAWLQHPFRPVFSRLKQFI